MGASLFRDDEVSLKTDLKSLLGAGGNAWKRALDDSATFLDGQASRRLLLVENTCAPDGCFHIRSDVLGDEAQHVPVQCSLHDDLDLIDAYNQAH